MDSFVKFFKEPGAWVFNLGESEDQQVADALGI